jgi:hypothetical protein
MKLSLPFAKKLFTAIVLAILALVFLMIPVDMLRIHDEFLRLMLSGAVACLIIYIFYIYRKALKEASLRSVRNTVKKFEPGFMFPDELGSEDKNPEN